MFADCCANLSTFGKGNPHVDISDDNRKSAFTLAEVLITLGVIGIVAAMTLPSLINNIKEAKFKNEAKKAYSAASQALLMMKDDEGGTFEGYVRNVATFKESFMSYFHVAKDCKINKCVSASYHSELYKTLNGEKADTTLMDEGQFYTTDGVLWMIQNSQYYDWLFISVDVNGLEQKPNVWGKDLFTFWVTPNGNLKPMGSSDSRWPVSKSCDPKKSLNSNGPIQGIGCMTYVLSGTKY